MKAKSWIILGFIGIVVGTVIPAILMFGMMKNVQSDPFSGQIHQTMRYMMIFGALSQILFWGGIVSTIFGFIKYYKEKN